MFTKKAERKSRDARQNPHRRRCGVRDAAVGPKKRFNREHLFDRLPARRVGTVKSARNGFGRSSTRRTQSVFHRAAHEVCLTAGTECLSPRRWFSPCCGRVDAGGRLFPFRGFFMPHAKRVSSRRSLSPFCDWVDAGRYAYRSVAFTVPRFFNFPL